MRHSTSLHSPLLTPGCRTLGALAEKCHAFAKALHYKEHEYQSSPETAVEALISINNHLRQPEAAVGILTLAQQHLHMELKVSGRHVGVHMLHGYMFPLHIFPLHMELKVCDRHEGVRMLHYYSFTLLDGPYSSVTDDQSEVRSPLLCLLCFKCSPVC